MTLLVLHVDVGHCGVAVTIELCLEIFDSGRAADMDTSQLFIFTCVIKDLWTYAMKVLPAPAIHIDQVDLSGVET